MSRKNKIEDPEDAPDEKIEPIEGIQICPYCDNSYKKDDFNFCPICGVDDGGTLPKMVQKKVTRKRRLYIKNINPEKNKSK